DPFRESRGAGLAAGPAGRAGAGPLHRRTGVRPAALVAATGVVGRAGRVPATGRELAEGRFAGLVVRHRLVDGHVLVALHLHAPLRRLGGAVGGDRGLGARGVSRCLLRLCGRRVPVAATAAGVGRGLGLRLALVAGRTAAGALVHRLSLGCIGLCARRRTLSVPGALGRRVWHRLGGGTDRVRRRRAGAAARLTPALAGTCGPAVGAGGRRPVGSGTRPGNWFAALGIAAAGEHPAGPEVRGANRRAAGARLVCGATGRQQGAAGRRARDRHPAAAPAVARRLPAGASPAVRPRRAGGAGRHPAGELRAGLHQFGHRPEARGAGLPLRQAPPGSVRRVHPAPISLVHRPDEHPAGRLQPGLGRPALVRVAGPAPRAQRLLRRPLRRGARRALRGARARPDHLRQRQQHRLVRQYPGDRPAPPHQPHAGPGIRAAGDPRHQHGGHRDHRPSRAGHPFTATLHAWCPRGPGRGTAGPHAVCLVGFAPGPRAAVALGAGVPSAGCVAQTRGAAALGSGWQRV
ncbi:MAG: Apolipoprotein N-acyltransferase / Copper homeostasis protein CutE, partial [uncultured Ramlibacter sp.]